MEYVLDNPVWNALISGNEYLARGSQRVKFFDHTVSPFAALIENTPANLLELYEVATTDRPVLLWAMEPLRVPQPWLVVDCIKGFQMVYDLNRTAERAGDGITALTEKHVPEMLSLTRLTQPGPFNTRTIEFGHYEGILEAGRLVAMTGQRFHCFNYMELSAVCTHPGSLGKGYAKKLLLSHINRLKTLSCQPYLHVRADNERAIYVYQALGFSIRIPVYFYVLKKS